MRVLVTAMIGLVFFAGCSTAPARPCTNSGGQPARDPGSPPFRGIKRCYQVQDDAGNYVNDGKYFEWYTNDHIALEGVYEKGKKVGRWIEYDESGKKISDKFFKEGKEIPHP